MWKQRSGATNVVAFCKVPRGTTECTGTVTLTPEGEDILGRPYVVVRGGNPVVVTNRCCYTGPSKTFVYVSSDGGASFGPPILGTLAPSGDMAMGGDGSL